MDKNQGEIVRNDFGSYQAPNKRPAVLNINLNHNPTPSAGDSQVDNMSNYFDLNVQYVDDKLAENNNTSEGTSRKNLNQKKGRPKGEPLKYRWTPKSAIPRAPFEQVLDKLQKKDIHDVFGAPVDPEMIPDYFDVISNPMDYGTVREKLSSGEYTSFDSFEADIILICDNAMTYNATNTIYYRQAKSMKELLPKLMQTARERVVLPGQPGWAEGIMEEVIKREKPAVNRADPAKSAPVRTDNLPSAGVSKEEKTHGNVDSAERSKIRYGRDRQRGGNDYRRSVQFVKDNRRFGAVPRVGGIRKKIGVKSFVQKAPLSRQAQALSLAKFASDFGQVGWETAAKKIRSLLGPNVPFGPGWVIENKQRGEGVKQEVDETDMKLP